VFVWSLLSLLEAPVDARTAGLQVCWKTVSPQQHRSTAPGLAISATFSACTSFVSLASCYVELGLRHATSVLGSAPPEWGPEPNQRDPAVKSLIVV